MSSGETGETLKYYPERLERLERLKLKVIKLFNCVFFRRVFEHLFGSFSLCKFNIGLFCSFLAFLRVQQK